MEVPRPNHAFFYLNFLTKIFKYVDFDGDNFIGSSDIEHAVKLLTQNELNHEEIELVWEKVSHHTIYKHMLSQDM